MDTKIKVGVLVIGNDGRVLLIKEKYKNNPTSLWNIIKGTHDVGETIFETAVRECREETSLQITVRHSLGVYISEAGEKVRVQFNFIANSNSTEAELPPQSEQESRDEFIQELRWFTKEELTALNDQDFISQRAFELIQDWLSGKVFPIEVVKQVAM